MDLLWVGSANGMERSLVERAGIAYRSIESGQIKGKNPLTVVSSLNKMRVGIGQSKQIIAETKPDVCFVTGGYVCAPMVIACWQCGVPVLIYLPDMSPGWAIRWMSKLAQRVAVSFEEAAQYFGGTAPRGKAVVTGYPVRQEVLEAAQDRTQARRTLAQSLHRPLLDEVPLVLVWGGSSGARSINRATWALLPEVLNEAHILHVVGTRDWPLFEEQKLSLREPLVNRYHPAAYLHEEMALALAAADLTISRAGASALGEYPVAKLPSILVPLTGVKQEDNAELLAKYGGAVVIPDEALGEELKPMLLNLLQRPLQRVEMEHALEELAKPEAALNIARELVKLGKKKG
ncbi:MAG: glycosyltransferase [Caldilineaceae bacterium]